MAKPKKLPWSPVRGIMKSKGALIVARDAVDFMISKALELIEEKTAAALQLTRHAKRTKLTRDDLDLVFKMK